MVLELVLQPLVGGDPLGNDDVGDDDFTTISVITADDAGELHGAVGLKAFLDLRRADAVARRRDDVVIPAFEPEVALAVAVAPVAEDAPIPDDARQVLIALLKKTFAEDADKVKSLTAAFHKTFPDTAHLPLSQAFTTERHCAFINEFLAS